MNILSHFVIPVYSLPGLQHQTIASKSDGTHAVEVWKQTLAPGSATPPHFHECEEIIYVFQGMGEIAIEGKTLPFAADCTLFFPPRLVHQITNSGPDDMRLAAWFSESPARAFLPSGELLALPWDRGHAGRRRPQRATTRPSPGSRRGGQAGGMPTMIALATTNLARGGSACTSDLNASIASITPLPE